MNRPTSQKDVELTLQLVKELFLYDDKEGRLIWRAGDKAGQIACHPGPQGYRRVCIRRINFRAHRIIFLLAHGWLPHEVDHRDRVRDNNRIGNLRPATTAQNQWNRLATPGSASHYKGISRTAGGVGNWSAYIQVGGKSKYIGTFATEECAAAAYNEAAKQLHGEFALLNDVPTDHQPKQRTQKNQKKITGKPISASGYRGVYPVKKYSNKWVAIARVNQKNKQLGTFPSPELAAAAYDHAVTELHGAAAQTNVKAGLLDPSIAPRGPPAITNASLGLLDKAAE